MKIYVEWLIDGSFENGIFDTWDEVHSITFCPDVEILAIKKFQ